MRDRPDVVVHASYGFNLDDLWRDVDDNERPYVTSKLLWKESKVVEDGDISVH